MKTHRQVNLSRRDVQRVMVSGTVIVIYDHYLVLVLFWYERGGEHFCVCTSTSKSATVSRIEHFSWEHMRRAYVDEHGVCVQTLSVEDE